MNKILGLLVCVGFFGLIGLVSLPKSIADSQLESVNAASLALGVRCKAAGLCAGPGVAPTCDPQCKIVPGTGRAGTTLGGPNKTCRSVWYYWKCSNSKATCGNTQTPFCHPNANGSCTAGLLSPPVAPKSSC